MTDGDLYDLLQKWFGIGEWDEDVSSQPWWKARALEISKIKRSRTSRNVDLEDLALAAEYCKQHHLPVANVAWLYRHIAPAIRWRNERSRAARVAQLDDLLAEAIQIESDNPDSEWLDRLVRARGDYKREVYEAWLRRSSSSPHARPEGRAASSA